MDSVTSYIKSKSQIKVTFKLACAKYRRAIAVTPASASALVFRLKFLVKVFRSLYLLNFMMDLVDTLPVIRYWSEVLFFTIMTHLHDLGVKVMDFEI